MGISETHQVRHRGKVLNFSVKNPSDVIQSKHVKGKFFEIEDLELHRTLIPNNGVVVDVGANVGNHSVFYANFTRARWIYPLEPIPDAREILKSTVRECGNDRVFFDVLQYGAGARNCNATIQEVTDTNLGRGRLYEESAGSLKVASLDTLLQDISPDFIKIDVEGMELDVLFGAEGIISTCRPIIAVEVNNANIKDFCTWCDSNEYHVFHICKANKSNINYMCTPKRRYWGELT